MDRSGLRAPRARSVHVYMGLGMHRVICILYINIYIRESRSAYLYSGLRRILLQPEVNADKICTISIYTHRYSKMLLLFLLLFVLCNSTVMVQITSVKTITYELSTLFGR